MEYSDEKPFSVGFSGKVGEEKRVGGGGRKGESVFAHILTPILVPPASLLKIVSDVILA